MNKVAIAVLTLASVASGEVFKEGSYEFRAGGRVHRVQYKLTQAVPDEAIVDADKATGLANTSTSVWCYGWGEVQMIFKKEADSKAFQKFMVDKVASEEGAFVVSEAKNCNFQGGKIHSTDNSTGMNLRRVNKVTLSGFPSQVIVHLQTSPAHYDEVIKEGAISYGSSPDNPGRDPLHLCFGMNVGNAATCNTAATSLPVYSRDALSVTCDNCFMGFSFDLFADFHFANFAMAKLSAGFKNMQASGAVDLAMNVAMQHSFLGVDKDLWHAGGDDHPIISFKVGLIPFSISFDAAIHLAADMQCSASAQAQAGVAMQHVIGDNYLTWDSSAESGKKWAHVHGTPTTTFTPTVSGSADFDCTGSVSLVPSFDLHMSQLFSYQMSLTPKVAVELKGDKDGVQLCETASYDLELSSSAQMHFSTAFGLIHADASWGPVTWGKSKQDAKTHCQGKPPTAAVVV